MLNNSRPRRHHQDVLKGSAGPTFSIRANALHKLVAAFDAIALLPIDDILGYAESAHPSSVVSLCGAPARSAEES